MKINKLRANPANPRVITDNKFKKLVKSLLEFPEMLNLRPIVHDRGIVLGANMRLKAITYIIENWEDEEILELAKGSTVWLDVVKTKEIPDDWAKDVSKLTDEQKRSFIIKDNIGYGEWDWEALSNQWDKVELEDWGLDVKVWNEKDDDEPIDDPAYNVEYRLEVMLKDESEQEQLFNRLTEDGYSCKILTL